MRQPIVLPIHLTAPQPQQQQMPPMPQPAQQMQVCSKYNLHTIKH